MVRRAFGPKGKEETGGLVNMHDETLHDLKSSSSIIRVIEAGMMGMGRKYVTFVGRNIQMWVFGGEI